VACRGVAGGVGDDHGPNAGIVPAHQLLGDVAAQAESHQHDLVGGESLQQRLDVVHGGREVEPPGGCAVAPQIRGYERKAILQGRDLGVPRVVVEGGPVEQDQRGIGGGSRRLTDPVVQSGVRAFKSMRRADCPVS
jgi:hypothetical protein